MSSKLLLIRYIIDIVFLNYFEQIHIHKFIRYFLRHKRADKTDIYAQIQNSKDKNPVNRLNSLCNIYKRSLF